MHGKQHKPLFLYKAKFSDIVIFSEQCENGSQG